MSGQHTVLLPKVIAGHCPAPLRDSRTVAKPTKPDGSNPYLHRTRIQDVSGRVVALGDQEHLVFDGPRFAESSSAPQMGIQPTHHRHRLAGESFGSIVCPEAAGPSR